MTPQRALEDVFVDVLAGETCSNAELEYAVASVTGGDRLTQIRASGVILAKGNDNQKKVAFAIIEKWITASNALSIEEEFLILVILMQLRHSFDFTLPFLKFVVHASKSGAPELRCNAAVILMGLAKQNQIAKDTLERLASDTDESVRGNALTGLKSVN
jgi:hypothetical protein